MQALWIRKTQRRWLRLLPALLFKSMDLFCRIWKTALSAPWPTVAFLHKSYFWIFQSLLIKLKDPTRDATVYSSFCWASSKRKVTAGTPRYPRCAEVASKRPPCGKSNTLGTWCIEVMWPLCFALYTCPCIVLAPESGATASEKSFLAAAMQLG